MLGISNRKQWGLGFLVGVAVAGLLSFGLSGTTQLQKGSIAPGAVQGAGFDPICSSLSVSQCEQSAQCQVFRVPNFGYQYCVRAGVSCTYTLPGAQISGLNVSPGSNANIPFDPLGSTPITITFNVNTGATVTGAIYKSGTLVKQLVAPTTYGGLVTMTWDGKDTSGQPVIQGTYELRVSAQGQSGTPADNKTAVIVVVPSRVLISMGSGAVTPSTIDPSRNQSAQLRFTVNKDVGIRIYMQPINNGQVNAHPRATVASVMNRPSVSAGEVTASWDGRKTDGTFATNGAYQFYIDAGGTFGGANVTVGVQQAQIGNYYVTPDSFDPNANEVVRVKFTPNVDVVAQVKVLESNGTTLVNDLTGGEWQFFRGGQEASVAWDGTRESNGSTVGAGTYKYTIQAIGQQQYLNSRSRYTDPNSRAINGVAGEVRLPRPGNITVAVHCQSIGVSRTDISDSRYGNRKVYRFRIIDLTPSSYAGAFNWQVSDASAFTMTSPVNRDNKVADIIVQNNTAPQGTVTVRSADNQCAKRIIISTGREDFTTQTVAPSHTAIYGPIGVVTTTPPEAQPALAITNVSADPPTFNPTSGQSTTLRFEANYDTNSIITITNSSGTTVTAMGGFFARGAQSMPWNGRNSSGALVPPGIYTATIDASAGSMTASAHGNVTVQAPQIVAPPVFIAPGGAPLPPFRAVSPATPLLTSCENITSPITCRMRQGCTWLDLAFGDDRRAGGNGVCFSDQ